MTSSTGHNPAAHDPAVIYWDWESSKTITRPPPGIGLPSKAPKYLPGLGPTEQSPWDKPYFQRPGSRSRVGTLRRADAFIGADQKSQPDVNLEKPTTPIKTRSDDKTIPSETMPNFPDSLHSESKRKAFEEMGNRFIENLQKLDKSGTGKISDFSPILENHWNELAEFYAEMVSIARMLKAEADSKNLAITKDSTKTHPLSSSPKFSMLDSLIAQEPFKFRSVHVEVPPKATHPTLPTPKQRTTHHPIMGDTDNLKQLGADGGSGTLDPVDDTKLVFSKGEKSTDAEVDEVALAASAVSTGFEGRLSEAIKSVRVDLKPLGITWDKPQAEGQGGSEVLPRNTEGTALCADTQLELESLEMIQQEIDMSFSKSIKLQEHENVTTNTTRHKYTGGHEEERPNFQASPTEGISDSHSANGLNKKEVYLGTDIKTVVEDMQHKDNDINSNTVDIADDTDKPHSKGGVFMLKQFEPEKCYSVVKHGEDVEDYSPSLDQLGSSKGDINIPEPSHTNENASSLAIDQGTLLDYDCGDVSSEVDSWPNTTCGSLPEEVTYEEVNNLTVITVGPIKTSIINTDERFLGLNNVEDNDSFSISSESSIFPMSTQDEHEKPQMEVTGHLEKGKTDDCSFTAKWIDQFGIKRERRSEAINPDVEPGTDQNASIYYDVEVSSEYEDETIDDIDEILAPMNALCIEGPGTDKDAKVDTHDIENEESTSAGPERGGYRGGGGGSDRSKKIGGGSDCLRLLEQAVAEPEKEFDLAKGEVDSQNSQDEDKADGEDIKFGGHKSHTGDQFDETVFCIKEMGNDG